MGNIDFSQVDLIVGVVIGAASIAVVGFMFWRAGVVKFSGGEPSKTEISTALSTLAELKNLIGEIRQDIRLFVKTQQDCQKELPEKYVTWDVLNHRILDKLDKDRERRWGEYDRHRHDPASGQPIK